MRHRQHEFSVSLVTRRVPTTQLLKEPGPFVQELTLGDLNGRDWGDPCQLGSIEMIVAATRLGLDDREVGVGRAARGLACSEAPQLRMTPISGRLTSQYDAREQCLAPEGDQARWIEVLRM